MSLISLFFSREYVSLGGLLLYLFPVRSFPGYSLLLAWILPRSLKLSEESSLNLLDSAHRRYFIPNHWIKYPSRAGNPFSSWTEKKSFPGSVFFQDQEGEILKKSWNFLNISYSVEIHWWAERSGQMTGRGHGRSHCVTCKCIYKCVFCTLLWALINQLYGLHPGLSGMRGGEGVLPLTLTIT